MHVRFEFGHISFPPTHQLAIRVDFDVWTTIAPVCRLNSKFPESLDIFNWNLSRILKFPFGLSRFVWITKRLDHIDLVESCPKQKGKTERTHHIHVQIFSFINCKHLAVVIENIHCLFLRLNQIGAYSLVSIPLLACKYYSMYRQNNWNSSFQLH